MAEVNCNLRNLAGQTVGPAGAFRVHIPPAILTQLGLKTGEICHLSSEDGTQGLGIAWRATEGMSNQPKIPPVKVTDTMRETFGFQQNSQVKLKKTDRKIYHANKVMLMDVTPSDYETIEDQRWMNRCRSTMDTFEAFAVGMTFDVHAVNKKALRRRFCVEQIESSEAPSDGPALYTSNDRTEVSLTDPSLPSVTPPISQSERNPFIDATGIGGLTEQIRKLNSRLRILCQRAIFQNASLSAPVNQAILLHGYQGTGKTLLLDRLAQTPIFGKVIRLRSSQLGGTSAKNDAIIHAAFSEALACQPSLIVMDRVDAIAPAGELTSSSIAESLSSAFNLISGTGVLVVGTCRLPYAIDGSLIGPERFEALIELPIPDQKARLQIMEARLQPESINDALCDVVASRTHGFTGNDMVELIRHAGEHALERYHADQDEWVEVRATAIPRDNETEATSDSQATTIIAPSSPPDFAPTLADFEAIFPIMRPAALREIILETPKVSWSDIGGSTAMNHRFNRIIEWPKKHAKLFQKFNVRTPRGILLYGPPGCSKTMTAQAVASTYGHNFIAVKGAELISMYVGESERAVREVFRKARAAAPCIIFFDEIDAIASSRGDDGGTKGLNVLTTLLNEMDGFEALRDVFVLAATNAPQALDPALLRPGRFDAHIYLGPPDASTRLEIMRIRTRDQALSDDIKLDELIEKTAGHSGAEMVEICNVAQLQALERSAIAGTEEGGPLTASDFEEGITTVRKGITTEMLMSYEDFGNSKA